MSGERQVRHFYINDTVDKQQEVCDLHTNTWQFPRAISAFATSPDGRLVVTGCEDGLMRVHDCIKHELLCETTADDPLSVLMLAVRALDGDDVVVATAHCRSTVRFWYVDVGGRRLRMMWENKVEMENSSASCCQALCVSHDHQWVAMGATYFGSSTNYTHNIYLFKHPTGELARVLVDSTFRECLCFSPDDRFLVNGCGDGDKLCVWSMENGEWLQRRRVEPRIHRMSPVSGVGLVSLHDDESLWLWPLQQLLAGDENVRYPMLKLPASENVRQRLIGSSTQLLHVAENGTHAVVGRCDFGKST